MPFERSVAVRSNRSRSTRTRSSIAPRSVLVTVCLAAQCR
jgi:hypothetical protein